MIRSEALDADGKLHAARSFDVGRGANPDTTTCSCGGVFASTPLEPDFERHLADVESRDAFRSIDEARRKLARAKGATYRGEIRP